MEKFLVDLALGKPYVFALMDRVMHYSLGMAMELIELGDDFGSQTGMIISPDLWRELFKEWMRFVIGELKAEKPELKAASTAAVPTFPSWGISSRWGWTS